MSATILTLPSHMAGFLHELGPPSSGVYSFVSYPSAILPNRPKYRSEQPTSGGGSSSSVNIMHDRRVVRGNTYAANHRIPLKTWQVSSTDDDIIKQRQMERKSYVRKRVLPNISGGGKSLMNKPNFDINTSDTRYTEARARVRKRLAHSHADPNNMLGMAPVEGRKHTDIQTEKWLEEIKDKVPETDAAVQTDAVIIKNMSRSDSPEVPPSRSPDPGIDKSTQILPDDPDLFVFDEEVGIVLEALVGKTLEMSLLEVIEEEEEISKLKLDLKPS